MPEKNTEAGRKPVRIAAPVFALLGLNPEQPVVLHARGKFSPGDIVSDGNAQYIVAGAAPRGKSEVQVQKVDHNEVLLAQMLHVYAAYPDADALYNVDDFEESVLRFRVVEIANEMQYSHVVLIEGGVNKPWQIDALLSKRKFQENPLQPGKEYVAYGYFRWSGTGFLRFYPITVVEWRSSDEQRE